jgi:hypothetical protein
VDVIGQDGLLSVAEHESRLADHQDPPLNPIPDQLNREKRVSTGAILNLCGQISLEI